MRVYRLASPPEKNNVTQWHFLWPPASDNLRQLPLRFMHRLAEGWEPPLYEVLRRLNTPDIFACRQHWAVTKRVVDAIVPRTGDDVEFLALECSYEEPLFLLHVLRIVDLGPMSVVTRNPVSNDISTIPKCDFEISSLSSCTLFRVRQAPDSLAAKAGAAYNTIFCTEEFADFLIDHGFKGLHFVTVFDSEE